MKTGVKFSLSAVTMIAVSLSSCVSENGEPINSSSAVNEVYATSFIKTFGTPANDQDWGKCLADAAVNTTAGIYEMNSSSIAPSVKWTNVDGNNWYQIQGFKYENIPVDVTSEEEAEAVKQLSDPNVQGITELNFNDFFVQHVHTGTDYHTDGNGQKVLASSKMSQLTDGTGTHINGFNNCRMEQEVTINSAMNTFGRKQYIMLVQNGDPTNFGYSNTADGGKRYANKGTGSQWDNTVTGDMSRTVKIGKYYYIGFKFCAKGWNPNEKIDEGDGGYTDWIIRVAPLVPEMYEESVRVLVEDVSYHSDFDFNDLVFDAVIANGEAKITVQALGGTLPVCIGEPKDAADELHGHFDVDVKTMVNTYNQDNKREPYSFTIKGISRVEDIPVYVMRDSKYVKLNDVTVNNAPAIIYVPTSCAWATEQTPFNKAYPNFLQYVGDKNVKFWENPVKTGTYLK